MRHQLDRYETMLLLATRKQGKPTLHCCWQFTRPVINTLPPLSSYRIPWTRRLSSAGASVVIVVVFVIIFIRRRLRCSRRFLRPVVYLLLHQLLSLIPLTRCIFLVLCRSRRHHHWVRSPVLICQRRCHCCQYPDSVKTQEPPPLETFTRTCCIFSFLNWRLSCNCQDLGLIIL